MKERLNAVHSNSVRNESGSIVARHHDFTQILFAIVGEELNDFRRSIRRWNYLQELQIARRIEKVCSAKVFFEIIAPAFSK